MKHFISLLVCLVLLLSLNGLGKVTTKNKKSVGSSDTSTLWLFTKQAGIQLGPDTADDRFSIKTVIGVVPPVENFNPATQTVSINFNGTVIEFPPASFQQSGVQSKWKLRRGVNEKFKKFSIDLKKDLVEISAVKLNLNSPTGVVTFSLTVGDYSGSEGFECTTTDGMNYTCIQRGVWEGPIDLHVVGIHAALLYTGKVLLWSYPQDEGPGAETWLYNPATGVLNEVSINRDIFCGGHSFLADGKLLVTSGTDPTSTTTTEKGLLDTHIFDPLTETFTRVEDMAAGRWYPTNVTLADGRVLIFSGLDQFGEYNQTVELYTVGNGWQMLPATANRFLDLYPFMHLLPSGKIIHSGPEELVDIFDPATNTREEIGSLSNYHYDGTAVLLPGLSRILVAAGGKPAEIVDVSSPTPVLRLTSRKFVRAKHTNSVLLPDGNVLYVGGGRKTQLFNPATERWVDLENLKVSRKYHSTALLLPDGRVLAAGTDGKFTGEIFSPPYLFRGPRPQITSAPTSITYGSSFQIVTPEAANIHSIALVRPSAVTHSFDQDQRLVELDFTASSETLQVQAPPDGNHAPPGYYMLFIVSKFGVPSQASFVQVSSSGNSPSPELHYPSIVLSKTFALHQNYPNPFNPFTIFNCQLLVL